MYIGEGQKQIVQGSGVIVSKLRSAKVVKNGCHPMSQWVRWEADLDINACRLKSLTYRPIKDLGQRFENGWSIIFNRSHVKIFME